MYGVAMLQCLRSRSTAQTSRNDSTSAQNDFSPQYHFRLGNTNHESIATFCLIEFIELIYNRNSAYDFLVNFCCLELFVLSFSLNYKYQYSRSAIFWRVFDFH